MADAIPATPDAVRGPHTVTLAGRLSPGRQPMAAERTPAAGRSGARLVIVDDHDLAREGLRSLLAGEPGLQVVGEAASGREALALCRRLRPDLVLMDVRMPDLDGLTATRALKQECPGTSVILVTMHEDPDYLLEAIKAGAAGYVLKGATKRELVSAVRRVLAGESVLEPDLTSQLLRRLAREPRRDAPTPAEPLTPREREVLRLVARGYTNQEIATELMLG